MSERPADDEGPPGDSTADALPPDRFQTTQWSVVLHAGARSTIESQEAMARLCQTYWWPLYCYVRRRVRDADQAQDLTQAFFASLLEKDFLRDASPLRGRFRAFLLTALKRFMANDRAKHAALKRGGGKLQLSLDFNEGERYYSREPVDTLTADQIYLRHWAQAMLDRVRQQLRLEFESAGKGELFRALEVFITPLKDSVQTCDVAAQLRMSESAVRVAAHRLRQRYRRVLREEIAQTVADPGEIDDEIRSLFAAFSPP